MDHIAKIPDRITAVQIKGADAGYYITPEGVVLKVMKPYQRRGYWQARVLVGGTQKNFSVHRLIAENYIPNPENKPQVNHINGNKLDNRVDNLEWVTPGENTRHAHKMGLVCHHTEAVEMLDKTGKLLRVFSSHNEAYTFLGRPTNSSAISQCATGKLKTAYGYVWRRPRNKGGTV